MRHGNSRSDRRNLHLHRVALRKLRDHPELAHRSLALVDRWLDDDDKVCSRPWLVEWRDLLDRFCICPGDDELSELSRRVLDEENGQALRQCSPLGPVLTPRERWAALEEINAVLRTEEAREL